MVVQVGSHGIRTTVALVLAPTLTIHLGLLIHSQVTATPIQPTAIIILLAQATAITTTPAMHTQVHMVLITMAMQTTIQLTIQITFQLTLTLQLTLQVTLQLKQCTIQVTTTFRQVTLITLPQPVIATTSLPRTPLKDITIILLATANPLIQQTVTPNLQKTHINLNQLTGTSGIMTNLHIL